jgi:hypothetical protein
MKYLLLLTNDADQLASWEAMSEDEQRAAREAEVPRWNELMGEMTAKGQLVDGLELDEPHTAKCVQVRDGQTVVTDGPFAETKEQIGGFFLVECADLDEAIDLAARVPVASKASVEIRPLVER